jgi:sec-independent protein translocase protein TatA
MPNIGWPELLVVLVIALVIFGPKRLPDIGRQLGRGLREFKKATSEIQDHFDLSLEDKNEKTEAGAQASAASATTAPPTAPPAASTSQTEVPAPTSLEASVVQAPDVVDGEVLREETDQPAHTVSG